MSHIQLRAVEPTDLPIFFEFQRDPLAVHMAAFTTDDPDNRAAFDTFWARILADENILLRTIVVDGAVAGSVTSYVGDIGPEVTYWLGRGFWGRGIATAALAQFLRQQTTRPIYARAATDNAASLRVLAKNGFIITGQSTGYADARGQEISEYTLELAAT